MKQASTVGVVGVALLATLRLVSPARAQEDEANRYQALLEQKAASVVTVRLVMKTEFNFGGQGQNRESREEVAGVLVSDDGMVLVSYDSFRSDADDGSNFQMKRRVQEIKIVFEREEKEYDGELVATDKKVNLAFIQVNDLEGRKISPVSFEAAVKAEAGARVASVSRLDKGFDYAPYVRTARICGKIRKPRKALMLDGSIRTEGLPVYTMDGSVVGVLTSLESGMADDSGGGSFFGFGGGSRQFVLPGKVVSNLIRLARKQAAEAAAERAEEEAEKKEKEAADKGEDG